VNARVGVNLLWVCLLVIVVGAFAGRWFAVMQKLGLKYNFWFGHQGWEYVDLGRFWQLFLFVGLLLWLALVGRALWPALRRKDDLASITGLLFLSTIAIALFYGAGLMWGEHTSLSMVEYWRWWVVHLWVEGFFEVFAVAVISFLFVKLGLVRARSATASVLFATIVFMAGGILGTFHHLYFTGTTVVLDHGAGVVSLFAHLSRVDVRQGESVTRGTVLGAVGATGRVTGPHLHWTVRLHGTHVDPMSLVFASTIDVP